MSGVMRFNMFPSGQPNPSANGLYVRHEDYAALEAECERLREALRMARLFIRNGIDLGYIKMPDDDTPDPAHDTLPMIDAALSTKP